MTRGVEIFSFVMLALIGKWVYAIFIGATPGHIEYAAHLTFDVLTFSGVLYLAEKMFKTA